MSEEFQPGEVLRYQDEGEIYKVEVLKNLSDEEWIRYELKVLEVEQIPSFLKPPEIGEEFECCRKRSASGFAYCMWRLSRYRGGADESDRSPGCQEVQGRV